MHVIIKMPPNQPRVLVFKSISRAISAEHWRQVSGAGRRPGLPGWGGGGGRVHLCRDTCLIFITQNKNGLGNPVGTKRS